MRHGDDGRRNGFPAKRTQADHAADPMRLPPQNLEAEQGVIGGIVLDNAMLHEVVPILKADDFYRDSHQTIYRAIVDLYTENKPVDPMTLVEELTRRGEFERIGGDDAMGKILSAVPIAANARYYAEIVRDKSRLRSLLAACLETARACYANQQTAADVLQDAERAIYDIASRDVSTRVLPVGELIPAVLDDIDRRCEGEISGVLSGFTDLDAITSGFRPGQLIILAARPSMGKSALGMAFALHAAKLRFRVLYTSLEMSAKSLTERILAMHAEVSGKQIRTGLRLSPFQRQALGATYLDLKDAGIYIDDTPAQSMLHTLSLARRLKLRGGLDLVIVDYLQLIAPDDPRESRQEQVAGISRRLKEMARELDVPVVALSQLNRKCEERPDKRPVMADLRESGAIENDADIIILLHRPERYDPKDQPNIANLDVVKNREGATGSCDLFFRHDLTRFENLAKHAGPEPDENMAF